MHKSIVDIQKHKSKYMVKTEVFDAIVMRSSYARCGCLVGRLSVSGPHVRVDCANCRTYCYFIRQSEIADATVRRLRMGAAESQRRQEVSLMDETP